jgi:hypothetical protein
MHPVVIIYGIKESAIEKRDFAVKIFVIVVIVAAVNPQRLIKKRL